MNKPKASPREKAMDEAIAETRRPYDYRITMMKLDKAAREAHEYMRKVIEKQK